jgi:hypothetical protein
MAGQGNGDTAWLVDLFDAVDSLDTKRFLAYLTPDAGFRFGSAPLVVGAEQIGAAVDGFFASIAGCSHRIEHTWTGNGTIACEGEVTYRRSDGTEITLPFANVFDMAGELISHYKIYIDIGPLYAE